MNAILSTLLLTISVSGYTQSVPSAPTTGQFMVVQERLPTSQTAVSARYSGAVVNYAPVDSGLAIPVRRVRRMARAGTIQASPLWSQPVPSGEGERYLTPDPYFMGNAQFWGNPAVGKRLLRPDKPSL